MLSSSCALQCALNESTIYLPGDYSPKPCSSLPPCQFTHLFLLPAQPGNGGICQEKAGERKRDRKTIESQERAVHGPVVHVVRGQSMFDVLSAMDDSV